MASIFTSIINGEIPGHFVWKDDRAVAFMTIAPIRPGHTLVVPIEEVEHWIDLDPDLFAHLTGVSQAVGKAIDHAFDPEKVGVIIAGLEVPHVHLHLIPIRAERDLTFANADHGASAEQLEDAANRIRDSLRALGYAQMAG